MGGSDSKYEEISKIDSDQWQTITTGPNLDIVKNRHNHKQGQVRLVPLNPKTPLDEELDTYHYRKHQNDALVACYGVQQTKDKSAGMCSNDKHAKVLTERMPRRWWELPQLTADETNYALGEALKGYDNLYKRMGAFDVTPNMVGVNEEGKVKVWANENFALNHPATEKHVLETTAPFDTSKNKKQSLMVKNVLDVVEQRCEDGNYPFELKQRLLKNSDTFSKAKNELNSYNREKGKILPNFISPDSTKVLSKHEEGPVVEQRSRFSNLRSGVPVESKPIIPIVNSTYKTEPNQIAKYESAPPADSDRNQYKYRSSQTPLKKDENLIQIENSAHRLESAPRNFETYQKYESAPETSENPQAIIQKYESIPQTYQASSHQNAISPYKYENIPHKNQETRFSTSPKLTQRKSSAIDKLLTNTLMESSELRPIRETYESRSKSSNTVEPVVGATRTVDFRNTTSSQQGSNLFNKKPTDHNNTYRYTQLRQSSQPLRKTDVRFSYISPAKNQIRTSEIIGQF